ncbi:hypothetical protein CTAYLR_003545 [Chrysophaeum taylorii]|uniref:Methyltransferase domain-containing protein n=1 Tax=Chrysophaeum taylorii TaxID=2483200 RepID=A0AAD7UN69_9STRA|nr:hypothetical protein CTAYLR_003545 [Chrysophaeum taylorii]
MRPLMTAIAASSIVVDLAPVEVRLRGGLCVTVFEASDQDAALEAAIDDGSDPFGSMCWPSSMAAANELLSAPLEGRTVLELGAGPGLASIAALHRGAAVIATDCARVATRAARDGLEAARARGAPGTFRVESLDISDHEALAAKARDADILVASDMLYEPELAKKLGAALRPYLATKAILVTDPGRQKGRGVFLRELGPPATSLFEDVRLAKAEAAALRITPDAAGHINIGVFKHGFVDLQ